MEQGTSSAPSLTTKGRPLPKRNVIYQRVAAVVLCVLAVYWLSKGLTGGSDLSRIVNILLAVILFAAAARGFMNLNGLRKSYGELYPDRVEGVMPLPGGKTRPFSIPLRDITGVELLNGVMLRIVTSSGNYHFYAGDMIGQFSQALNNALRESRAGY